MGDFEGGNLGENRAVIGDVPLQSLKAEFPSASEAWHDPADGMYKMRDPAKSHAAFVQDEETGLWAPAPKFKMIRMIQGAVGGNIQVAESMDAVKSAISHARSETPAEWYKFTEPTYGNEIFIAAATLQAVILIMEQLLDVENVEIQNALYEKQKTAARAQTLGSSNGGSKIERLPHR